MSKPLVEKPGQMPLSPPLQQNYPHLEVWGQIGTGTREGITTRCSVLQKPCTHIHTAGTSDFKTIDSLYPSFPYVLRCAECPKLQNQKL